MLGDTENGNARVSRRKKDAVGRLNRASTREKEKAALPSSRGRHVRSRRVPGCGTRDARPAALAFARIPRAVWRSLTLVMSRVSRARRARAAFNTRQIASGRLDRPSHFARWSSFARACREWGSKKGAGAGARVRCKRKHAPWDTGGPRWGTPPAPGGCRSPRRGIGSRMCRTASRARGCPETDFHRTCGTSPSRPPSP